MENNKQMQKAGANSQQVQMNNTTINFGITEARVREIFYELYEITKQNYTKDAYELAMKRVTIFEELLMDKVEQVNGMLEAFRDPSFQFLLADAQKRAAASDRESDFEMLTELLAHRVKQKDDRKIKASISKAVEIVDQLARLIDQIVKRFIACMHITASTPIIQNKPSRSKRDNNPAPSRKRDAFILFNDFSSLSFLSEISSISN